MKQIEKKSGKAQKISKKKSMKNVHVKQKIGRRILKKGIFD